MMGRKGGIGARCSTRLIESARVGLRAPSERNVSMSVARNGDGELQWRRREQREWSEFRRCAEVCSCSGQTQEQEEREDKAVVGDGE